MMGLLATMTAQAYDFEKDGIFYNVTSLEDLTVEVTYEEEKGHSNYYGEITIPQTVEWNERTFTVTAIGDWALYDIYGNITSINMPSSITRIEELAFGHCELDTIVIPDNVTYIGGQAFSGCENLKSVTFPNNLETISSLAFSECNSLKNIILPENLKILGNEYSSNNGVFENCANLSSVTLPGSLTDLGENTFNGCNKLDTVIVKSSTPIAIDESVFPTETYLNGTLFVPLGCKSVYQNAAVWKNFTNIVETDYADPTVRLLTVTVSGGGYVTFLGQTLENGSLDWNVDANSSVYISAYPEEGYRTVITVRDENGNSSTIEGLNFSNVQIGENPVTVEVTFTKIPVTLTVQQAESGYVEVEAEYGQTRTVRITPYEGWRINSVTLDGMDYTYMLDAENRFTTPELYSNAFLNVAFEQYDSDGVRGISADGTKVYAQEGRLVIDQATPGSLIRIYDESGREMKSFTTDGSRTETTLPANHVYIVKTPQKSVKIKL